LEDGSARGSTAPDASSADPAVEAPEGPESPGPEPEISGSRPAPDPVPDLRFRWAVDAPIFAAGVIGYAVPEALLGRIAPRSCRWCEPELNGFDAGGRSALRWSNTTVAARISDANAYGLIPVGMTALHLGGWIQHHQLRRGGVWWQDFIIVWESVAITAAATQGSKLAAARTRPYARFSPEPIPFDGEEDQNMSFWSGHTSLAFSMATATATVATLRKYRIAPVIWGVGMPLATFTAYLRVAGDRHYLSDVIVGAVAGGGIGFALPFLLHRPKPFFPRSESAPTVETSVLPFPNGAAVRMRF
jgi:membrane-associated phospholipid phosphatase